MRQVQAGHPDPQELPDLVVLRAQVLQVLQGLRDQAVLQDLLDQQEQQGQVVLRVLVGPPDLQVQV